MFWYVIDRLGPVERERSVIGCVVIHVLRARIELELQAGIGRRCRRQLVRMNVVAAAAKVVVSVPGDVGGQDGNRCSWLLRRHDPGEREESAGFAAGMEVVKSGSVRRRDELLVVGAGVAEFVPHYAGLRIVAVRCARRRRPWAMLREPAQRSDELLLPSVEPQVDLVRSVTVDAELALVAAFDPLRPGNPEQIVFQQTEVMRLIGCQINRDAFGAVAVFGEDYFIASGLDIRVDRAAGARASGDRTARADQFDLDPGQSDVSFVADVAEKHGGQTPRTKEPKKQKSICAECLLLWFFGSLIFLVL